MKNTTQIAELLDRMTRLLRNDIETGELKPVQWEVLRFLQRANRFSRTPGAVTAWLGITKGTVSQSLNALERSGYVRKLADADDKRVVRLALTPNGKSLLDNDPLVVLAGYLEDIEPRKLRVVEGVFSGILNNMLSERDYVKFGICSTCKHFNGAKKPTESLRYSTETETQVLS